MHEIGIRILVRKVQLIAAQYDKALIPVFSYAAQHYVRVFLMNTKGKQAVDAILENHASLGYCKTCGTHVISPPAACSCGESYVHAGPLWTGSLWNIELVKKMKLYELETIKDESLINVVGFYDIHELVSKYKLKSPRFDELISKIRKKGFKAARTHVSPYGIKSTIGLRELLTLMK